MTTEELLERRRRTAERKREWQRKWRAANPEKNRERIRRWRAENPEKNRERRRKDREANREKYREKNRERMRLVRAANPEKSRKWERRWRAANPEKVLAHARNRRARKRGAEGRHSKKDIDAIFQSQKWRCAYCRKGLRSRKFHVDHIIPLVAGGTNLPSNLQITCVDCNLQKGAKDPVVFAQSIGLLL